MKIAFVSVRGIPNDYGGFEEFAEHISVGLVKKGHEVTVYSPHFHPYMDEWYKGVRIKHIYSPEKWMGSSVGSFFYDFNSLRDALKRENFDIIYEAGYTSIIPAFIWFNVKKLRYPVVTTNMDGLEYKRSKFNKLVQRFILWEEKIAVRYSHHLVSDNQSIREYYLEKYGKDSKFLAYGADIPQSYNIKLLAPFRVKPGEFYVLIARMEPENNLAMVIEGYRKSKEAGKRPLIIIGKTGTPHGRELVARYENTPGIVFVGGLYDNQRINALRHFCRAYFHGHSVGGTNPSLLQAMATSTLIIANENTFNRSVLGDNALYFQTPEDITATLNDIESLRERFSDPFTRANLQLIRDKYSWDKLVDEHEAYFREILSQRR